MFAIVSRIITRLRHLTALLAAALVVLAAPSYAQSDAEMTALTDMHRDIIGRLSGDGHDLDTKPFAARATKAERAVARDHLVEMLTEIGLTTERQTYFMPNEHGVLDLFLPPVSGVNIVATLPATIDTDRIVVLGAHYDTVHGSPGANDNASGIAILLSTIRALSALENRSTAFVVVFFDQEEGGSFGSLAYVRDLKQSGANVHSVHTVDMAGSDNDGDGIVELDLPNESIAANYQLAANRLDIPVSRVTYKSSDHLSFRNAGFAAVCVSEEVMGGDMNRNYHKAADRLEDVDLDYTARVSRLLTAALSEVAAE